MLRYFHELVPQLHVVAAGSLLDFALRDFRHSMPVGRIEYLFLYPLLFEEFLLATEGEPLVEHLNRFRLHDGISEAVGAKLSESLRRCLFIGGMPEGVHAHAQKAALVDVRRIQSSIVQTLQGDFAKYGSRRQGDLLRRTLRFVAQNIGRKVKYVNISREHRAHEVKAALELPAHSRIVSLVCHTSANGIPLGSGTNEKRFKGLFLDVGLANEPCELPLVPVEQMLAVNEGALAEQFVDRELSCSGLPFQDHRLHYWQREARNANAEVDYVISAGSAILPVEVKSGKGGTLRSVFQFLQEKWRRHAVRFFLGRAGIETIKPAAMGSSVQLLSLPLYLAGQARRLAEEFCSVQNGVRRKTP